jgi:quercetin dioxygenase-like cupin family protein
MKVHRRPILAAVTATAAVVALVGAARLTTPTPTQPAPQVTTTILGKSLFGPIHVRTRADHWKAQLKTHGRSDVYVVDNKFPPGASTGWHSHAGPSLILVVAGTVTNYRGDDPRCRPQVYGAGAGFVDPGGGHLHMLRNESGAPAETIAVQLLPQGADRRIAAEAPPNCPA